MTIYYVPTESNNNLSKDILLGSCIHFRGRSSDLYYRWFNQCKKCGFQDSLMISSFIDDCPKDIIIDKIIDDAIGIELTKENTIISFSQDYKHYATYILSLITCLQTAIKNGYQYLAFIEYDMFFRGDSKELLFFLKKYQINAASVKSKIHNFIDIGLIFFDINYVIKSDLINKLIIDLIKNEDLYKQKKKMCEHSIQDILGKDIYIFDWYGDRDEKNQIDINKAMYITHSKKDKIDYFINLDILNIMKHYQIIDNKYISTIHPKLDKTFSLHPYSGFGDIIKYIQQAISYAKNNPLQLIGINPILEKTNAIQLVNKLLNILDIENINNIYITYEKGELEEKIVPYIKTKNKWKFNKNKKICYHFNGGSNGSPSVKYQNLFFDLLKKYDIEYVEITRNQSIDEKINIMIDCCYYIGVDSGPMHLARCVGIPVLCIPGNKNKESYTYQWHLKDDGYKVCRCLEQSVCEILKLLDITIEFKTTDISYTSPYAFGDAWYAVNRAIEKSIEHDKQIGINIDNCLNPFLIQQIIDVIDAKGNVVPTRTPSNTTIPDRLDDTFIYPTKTKWKYGPYKRICYQMEGYAEGKISIGIQDKIFEYFKDYEKILLGGNLTLEENIDILATSDLFIGTNSGMSHLCDSVGTPMIMLCSKESAEFHHKEMSFIIEEKDDYKKIVTLAEEILNGNLRKQRSSKWYLSNIKNNINNILYVPYENFSLNIIKNIINEKFDIAVIYNKYYDIDEKMLIKNLNIYEKYGSVYYAGNTFLQNILCINKDVFILTKKAIEICFNSIDKYNDLDYALLENGIEALNLHHIFYRIKDKKSFIINKIWKNHDNTLIFKNDICILNNKEFYWKYEDGLLIIDNEYFILNNNILYNKSKNYGLKYE